MNSRIGISDNTSIAITDTATSFKTKPKQYPVLACLNDMQAHLYRTLSNGALSGIINRTSDAWPSIAPTIYTNSTYMLIPISVIELITRIASEYGAPRAKTIHEFLTNCNHGFNNANFMMVTIIAAYLAVYEAKNHSGDNEVDTSNGIYLGAFVAPSLVLGLVFGLLNFYKSHWADVNNVPAKIAKHTHGLLNYFSLSGNMNALIAPIYQAFNISEMGDENEYERGAIFLSALALAGMLTLLNFNHSFSTFSPAILAVLGSTAYLYSVFSDASRSSLSSMEFNLLEIFYCILAFAALSTGLISYLVKNTDIKNDATEAVKTTSPSKQSKSSLSCCFFSRGESVDKNEEETLLLNSSLSIN